MRAAQRKACRGQVGGDVQHQQLSSGAQRTLDGSRQQHGDHRPEPAGGGGVAQADEVGGRVEEDQDEDVEGRNDDEGQETETR